MTKPPKKGILREPVSLYDAKTNLSSLVDRAASGEEFIITKSGKPQAMLVPLPVQRVPRKPGLGKGMWKVSANFDDPLPTDLLGDFSEEKK